MWCGGQKGDNTAEVPRINLIFVYIACGIWISPRLTGWLVDEGPDKLSEESMKLISGKRRREVDA